MKTVLETGSLVLRPWRRDDIDALVEGLGNLAVAQWLAFVPHPYSRADGLAWIEHCQRLSPEAGDGYEFAIERKSDRAMIGGVSLNAVDTVNGRAGGGIWINAAYQRLGYGREAFAARIRFAFDTLQLRELRNGYFRDNEASWELQRRLGYKHADEPPRQRLCLADGAWRDEILTRLSRQDWIRT